MSPLEENLPLSLVNRDQFLALFYESNRIDVAKKAAIHLHVTRVDAGNFDLNRLYTQLSNATLGYVLSRSSAAKAIDPARIMEYAAKVQNQFRPPDPKAGEGGEVLLYALLEGHLGAPKILSKMELKTDSNHYVFGSDGVHLLETEPNQFQLIFGEAKMYGDGAGKPGSGVKRAIAAAFKSMGEIHDEKFDFDTWLVDSELIKEAFDQSRVDYLASILIPDARDKGLRKANAFGVFIGYEIDVRSWKMHEMEDSEIEGAIRESAERLIRDHVPDIEREIITRGLGGYHFHMYAVPFLRTATEDMEYVRVTLTRALKNEAAPTEKKQVGPK